MARLLGGAAANTKGNVMSLDRKQPSPDWLELMRKKVQTLRFGVVQIFVHDSKVTQIDRTFAECESGSRYQMNSTNQITGGSQKRNTPTGLPEN